MKKLALIIVLACVCVGAIPSYARPPKVEPSYAWSLIPPLGLREPSTIDTTLINYAQESVPSLVESPAYATTGNFGTEGINMIFFEREPYSDFFFFDALRPYIPSEKTMRFYNTRIPMTLLTYNSGGGKEAAQDRLKGIFSGNINAKAQVGAALDYI